MAENACVSRRFLCDRRAPARLLPASCLPAWLHTHACMRAYACLPVGRTRLLSEHATKDSSTPISHTGKPVEGGAQW